MPSRDLLGGVKFLYLSLLLLLSLKAKIVSKNDNWLAHAQLWHGADLALLGRTRRITDVTQDAFVYILSMAQIHFTHSSMLIDDSKQGLLRPINSLSHKP